MEMLLKISDALCLKKGGLGRLLLHNTLTFERMCVKI